MKEYLLSIQTPEGEIFKGQASFIRAMGEQGEVGVLANHAPMIIALKRGLLKITTNSEDKFFIHDSGILEVKPNHDVLALVDDAEPVSNTDEAKEKLAAKK